MLSELLIHLTLKKLKTTNSSKHLKPGTVSGVSCRLHEIINWCLCGGRVPSLMLVAMPLGCGSCKGSNGTQKNKHKEGDISEHGGLCAVVLPSRKRGFWVLVLIFRIVSLLYSASITCRPESLLQKQSASVIPEQDGLITCYPYMLIARVT